jgi:hypothetical protein
MPKQFTKILDMLNTKAAANQFSPKTYINLVGEFSKKAYDNGELSKKEYMEIIQPLFGDAGIMASDKIKKYKDELNKYANGGRIGFLDGGDTKYNAMVTEMYIKLGGEEGTGMDIDSFAKEYFKKFNQGGRAGFRGGGMDMGAGSSKSSKSSGPAGGASSGGNYGGNNFKSDPDDNREQYGAQGQYSRPPSTPSDGGGDNKINLINTLNKFRPDTFVNPYNFSVDLNKNIGPFGLNSFINTLGILGIDDPRTPEDESEQDDYGISASYIRDLLGGDLVLGAGYSPTTGTNLGLSFSKQFNQGGRVNYNEGSPNTGEIRDRIIEIMDAEGLDFGEAFKLAMKELNREANSSND